MPTGVHLTDARARLFDAAEAVLRRDGVNGLTSRAVTTEAGVAKGVIHRYFPHFDAFLAELLLDRAGRSAELVEQLRETIGSGSVVDNLTQVLVRAFGPLAVAEMALVVTRDGVRERLRATSVQRLPVLAAAAALVSSYLLAEQQLGRISPNAEPDSLAPTLIGAVHLLFTEHQPDSPDLDTLRKTVQAVVNSAVTTHRHSQKRSTRPT